MYLGIDLGGTNISIGLVTEEGKILLKDSVPTSSERGYEAVVKDMAELSLKIIENYGIHLVDIQSVGVGSPGLPDVKNGKILYSNNLGFRDTPIREEFNKYISKPVYVENDANCAALGESTIGATRNYKDSITVTLGTGIGSGIILDNKIFSGSFYGGGEMGHMVICVDGEPCTCGRCGCWEAYASATALIRETRVAAAKFPDSELFNMISGNIKLISAKTPFDAADKGDEVAIEIIGNYFKYLSEGIANLINIFQPEVIAIGGGVSAQGDRFIERIYKNLEKLIYGNRIQTKIVLCELGNDAGIVGAAMLRN